MSFIWVIIPAAVVLGLLFGGNKGGRRSDDIVRIDHPHLMEDDDFECSVCHQRFSEDTMTCPHCGAQFTSRTEDDEEWMEEEDELEAWDEEEDT